MAEEPVPTACAPEEIKRRIASFLMHAQLGGRRLPEHLGDIPDRMLVDRLARADAKDLLETLREIYDVKHWDRESFEKAFVEGVLDGWRPGSLVQRGIQSLRIVSTVCPVASDVEKDARICQACRAIQSHAAYLALIGQIERVEFTRLMSRGESACEATIHYRRETSRAIVHSPS